MIFHATRKSCETEYMALRRVYGDKVILFHAGLSAEERRQIINDIEKGKYKIVISTTALGQGVNLPIYALIFKDMKLPRVEGGQFVGWRLLEVTEYKQISGRAGRQKFDTEGMAIIIAKSDKDKSYFLSHYLNGRIEELRTYLTIDKFVLVYLSRTLASEIDQIMNAMKYTYSLRNVRKEEVERILQEMINAELVSYNGVSYNILQYGKAIAYSYLDLTDAQYYRQFVDDKRRSLIEIIGRSPKVREIAKGTDFIKGIEDWIHGEELSNIIKNYPGITEQDARKILSTATWQAYAYWQILKALDKPRQHDALYLWQMIEEGVPKGALNIIRVKGVGRKLGLWLYERGITTKKELCNNKTAIISEMKRDQTWSKRTYMIENICGDKDGILAFS